MKTNSAKIIEFVGLHGSGKTTTAYALAEKLQRKGFSVKTNHDFWLETKSMNRWKRLLMYLFNPHTIFFVVQALVQICFGKVKLTQIEHKYQTHTITGPMKDIIMRDYIFLKKWKDVDYIILDEGSVYVTTDLVWKYQLSFNSIMSHLSHCRYLKQAKLFLFELDVDLATKRTGARNNGSFIDNLSDDKRREELASVINYYQHTYDFLQQSEFRHNIIYIDPREELHVRLSNLDTNIMRD